MIKVNRKKSHVAEDIFIDMTPMIDVTFILLLFFILTANVAQSVYPIKVPTADKSLENLTPQQDPLKITIFKGETFAVGSEKYHTKEALRKHLIKVIEKDPQRKITVIPDEKSESGSLIWLLTFFEGNKIENVDILVENGK